MFKRILCPMDFSERSRGAAHVARAFAHRFGSELIALHIVPIGTPDHLAKANSILNVLVSSEMDGCNVSTCVLAGDAADQIAQFAHDQHIELVVMGTHGTSQFQKFQLGSVASDVLHQAACPVWTSPHLEDWPAIDAMPIRSILCALDFGPRSCTALHWASCLAKEFGAKLTLAHVVVPGERERRFESPEDTLRRQQQRMNSPTEIKILEGTPAPVLSGFAEEIAADLMVIGRTHASSPGLGANAYAIIAHSPCPVLSA